MISDCRDTWFVMRDTESKSRYVMYGFGEADG